VWTPRRDVLGTNTLAFGTPHDTSDTGPEGSRAETRRRQVLDAALEVIAKRGVAQTRLVDVADEAGVSVGLVQHYFRRRETLLREAFAEALRQTFADFDEIAAAEPEPLARLLRFLRQSVMSERWPIWLEFWAISFREPELRDESAALYDEWVAAFHTAVTDGIEAGAFKPRVSAQDVADRLVAQIDGLAVRTLLSHSSIPRQRAIDLLVEQLEEELGVDIGEHKRELFDVADADGATADQG
jgi:AcrR family transcriptional regulator